tara:strand:- start:1137 stop:1553 length:417 start_codon:yes stop_codon:yes gene_type:complete
MEDEMKKFECFECEKKKPIDDYRKDPALGQGHSSTCKICEGPPKYYSDGTEIERSLLNFMDFIVFDEVMCHGAENESHVIEQIQGWCGDIPVEIIKECIKKHCDVFIKEAEKDLKNKDSECIYKHDYRLPGAGWSNQK